MRRFLGGKLNGGSSAAGEASAAESSTTVIAARKTFPTGLKLLHDSEDSVVDIVFIHGLTGDREKTWKAKNSSLPWPQTLLPLRVTNARILTFGYDAYVANWKGLVSENKIGNHAMNLLSDLARYRENGDTNDRPIIFVCHSLGGLVCEDALVAAGLRPEKHLKSILFSTHGILFLGTPHHGSGLAKWGERLAKSIGLLKQTNPHILAVLKTDSEVLARIQDSFHAMIRSRAEDGPHPIEITCFFEELALPGIGVVVPIESATLQGYIPIGIRSNHRDMVRFESVDDPGFNAVVGELCRWVKQIGQRPSIDKSDLGEFKGQNRKDKHTGYFIVPYPSNPDFVGRSDIVETLKSQLKYGPQLGGGTSQSRAALFGLGGIGKTQVALAYAYWVQERLPSVSVFWVHASTSERFIQAFSQMAARCSIPAHDNPKADVPKLVREWLEANDQRPFLMIIDNADDTEVFFNSEEVNSKKPEGTDQINPRSGMARYIPECSHGAILITTRNKQTGVKLTRNRGMIEITPMNEEDSTAVILKRLQDDQVTEGDVSRLADTLEHIPLALVQAAAYIQECSITVRKYLDLLTQSDNHLVELLSKPFEEIGRDSSVPNAVAATWMVSFTQIRKQYPYASRLLSLMSFFDRQGIPKLFLTGEYSSASHAEDKDGEMDEREANGVEKKKRRGETAVREGAEQGKEKEKEKDEEETDISVLVSSLELESALGLLKAFSFITESRIDESINMHRLIPLITRKWLMGVREYSQWASKALHTVSRLYPTGQYENWTSCRNYLPHAMSVLNVRSEKKDLCRALLLHNVADYLEERGQYTKAEEFLEEAIIIKKNHLGDDHTVTLSSMNDLALVYHARRQWQKAMELQEYILETSKKMLEEDHISTLTVMTNLASTYEKLGLDKEAVKLKEQVWVTSRKVLGEEHENTLTAMNNLANTYIDQGRYSEAKDLLERAFKMATKSLKSNHPLVLNLLYSLGMISYKMGLWTDAGKFYLRVFEGMKSILGEDHDRTLISMNSLASAWAKQGRDQEAESLASKCSDLCKRKLGPDHPHTLATMYNLALVKEKQGRDQEAEALLNECFTLYKRKLGSDHPDTLSVMPALVHVWEKQGRDQEAEALLSECLDLRKVKLGLVHPDTLDSMTYLALFWEKHGSDREAESLLREYFNLCKLKLGLDHSDTLICMYNLACIWKKQGRHEEAISLMSECVDVSKNKWGPDNPVTQKLLERLQEWQEKAVSGNT